MRRRWWIAVVAVAFALLFAWRARERQSPAPAPAAAPASPAPARATARPPKPSPPAPALHLARPASVRATRAAAPGALEGTVVDAFSGEGVAGAVLTFSHDDGAYSITAGGGGAFRFAPRETGRYGLVSLEAKGYERFEREFGRSPVTFTSAPGEDVTGIVLRMVPIGVISFSPDAGDPARVPGATDGGPAPAGQGSLVGRVFDSRTGAPLPAFAITLWRLDGLFPAAMMAASFVDPSGAYRIDGLAPGRYEASALAGGHAASPFTAADVNDGPVTVDFALHPGARVEGTVIDASSRRPLAGASVSLEGRRGDAPDLPVAPAAPVAQTGADGRFALEHISPDAFSLRVSQPGYLEKLVALGGLPQDGELPPLRVELTRRPAGSDASVELTGIGAILRPAGDGLRIGQLVPDAGAADAGLLQNDEIVAIDGTPVTALGYEGAIAAIRGPEGTTVTLRIRRSGREWEVVVTRKLVRA